MSRDFADALVEIIVHAVYAVLLRVGGNRAQHSLLACDFTDALTDLRAVRDLLGDNIHRARDCLLGRIYALFLIDEICCGRVGVTALFLPDDDKRERLESLFLGDARTRLALGLERTVDILQLAERLRLVERLGDRVSELFLRLDQAADLLSALVKTAQIIELFAERADQLVVHRAVHFLAVARDKRNGVSIIEQRDHVLCVLLFYVKFLCQYF